MTTLPNGWFQTTTNTPTGTAKQIAVNNPYVSTATFLETAEASGLGITSSSTIVTSGQLDKILLRASAYVNRQTGRFFDTQTIDETQTGIIVRPYNPQLVTHVCDNRPYNQINSIYIQVLKWFIQIQTTGANSYLQDFPDLGYLKIVPLLSNAGTGAGSPMPAEIVDKTALGVLWVNYTFGYGKALTGQTLSVVTGTSNLVYQAPTGNQLWAPSQTLNVYVGGVLQSTSDYTVDYPNGKVTFTVAPVGAVTADFTTNETIPADIQEATILEAAYMIGQAAANPLGAQSYGIQTYNVNFGAKNNLQTRIDELLTPYKNVMPQFVV